MAKLLHKFPSEIEEMDAEWFFRGLACEAYEADLQRRAQADAQRNGRPLRTMSGDEYMRR
jgi:hypothetical protein